MIEHAFTVIGILTVGILATWGLIEVILVLLDDEDRRQE